jgi:hypothetical protein
MRQLAAIDHIVLCILTLFFSLCLLLLPVNKTFYSILFYSVVAGEAPSVKGVINLQSGHDKMAVLAAIFLNLELLPLILSSRKSQLERSYLQHFPPYNKRIGMQFEWATEETSKVY